MTCFFTFHCQIGCTRTRAGNLRGNLLENYVSFCSWRKHTPHRITHREMDRSILDILATVVKDHENWESHLRATCMAYNTSVQSTTGQSPFFLVFGRRARIPIDLLCGPSETGEYVGVNDYVSQQS